jgi:hypothetical protein
MNQSCSSFPAPGGMKEHERCDSSDFAFFSLLQFKSKRYQAGPTKLFGQRALFLLRTWSSCVAPPRVDIGLPPSRFRGIDLIDLCGDQGVRRHCHFEVQPGN